jgi:hypothetical protein
MLVAGMNGIQWNALCLGDQSVNFFYPIDTDGTFVLLAQEWAVPAVLGLPYLGLVLLPPSLPATQCTSQSYINAAITMLVVNRLLTSSASASQPQLPSSAVTPSSSALPFLATLHGGEELSPLRLYVPPIGSLGVIHGQVLGFTPAQLATLSVSPS